MTTREDMIDTIKVVMSYLYKDVGDTWHGDLLSDVLEELTNNSDTVEVVRCKDCKWFHSYKTAIWCEKEEGLNHPKYDSFCSYGEREEDA
jgi:hypothetical protein